MNLIYYLLSAFAIITIKAPSQTIPAMPSEVVIVGGLGLGLALSEEIMTTRRWDKGLYRLTHVTQIGALIGWRGLRVLPFLERVSQHTIYHQEHLVYPLFRYGVAFALIRGYFDRFGCISKIG